MVRYGLVQVPWLLAVTWFAQIIVVATQYGTATITALVTKSIADDMVPSFFHHSRSRIPRLAIFIELSQDEANDDQTFAFCGSRARNNQRQKVSELEQTMLRN